MTLRDELHEWLAAQDLWQQELAKRLVERPQLDGEDYDDALMMVKRFFHAGDDDDTSAAPEAIALDDLPAGAVGVAPRLTSFGGLRGVGAVAKDQTLQFEPSGLTIVYGQNPAGKTTYVRALKRICRTVDCEAEVRGNVFAAAETEIVAPTATIELDRAGTRQRQRVDLTEPPDLGLDAISVFDSRCAEFYIDEENVVAYVPSALRLLARLASTQDRMRRGDLNRQADRFQRAGPSFPEFTLPTRVKTLLDGLRAATSVRDVEALAQLTDDEKDRAVQLRAVLASAAAQTSSADAGAARQDSAQAGALAGGLMALRDRVDEAKMEEIRAQAHEASHAQEAVEVAAQEFSGLPVPGVGAEPWRRMWEAARAFAETATAISAARGQSLPTVPAGVEPGGCGPDVSLRATRKQCPW